MNDRESFLSWIATRPGHPFARMISTLMWSSWQSALESERSKAQQERKPMTENDAQYLALCQLPISFRERGIAIVREVEAFHEIKGTP